MLTPPKNVFRFIGMPDFTFYYYTHISYFTSIIFRVSLIPPVSMTAK